MRAIVWLRSLWRNLVRRERVDRALDDEVHAYIDLLAADFESRGMTPAEARRAALVQTGGAEQVKEATRDAWVGSTIAVARREIGYALRTLRRSPGFLIVAVATLAIGISGATAVFTIIKGSLLRPLPAVSDADRLVTVVNSEKGRLVDDFSYSDYVDLRAHTSALTGLAGYNGTPMSLGDPGAAARVWVSFVSDDFFSVLGVRPTLGRMFDAASIEAGDNELVVIGHALWQNQFASSPSVIGSTLKLDGHVFTIVGVAPPGFIGAMALHPMQLWVPVAARGGQPTSALSGLDLRTRRTGPMWLVGRLATGKSIDDAQRELAATSARLAAAYPETNAERTVNVLPGSGMTPEERDELARVPRLVAMAVALLLLIACGNVASLFLVRASSRRRELATRLALGASRAALVRQVALEGTLVAAAAGGVGILLARVLLQSAAVVRAVVSMPDADLAMDRRVLAVALGAAALTAIAVSLVPAIQIFGVPAGAVLKDGGGAVRRRAGQRVLVSAQVGASLVLLYGAAVVFTAFQRMLALHEGVDPRAISDLRFGTRAADLDTTSRIAFYREVLARAGAGPDMSGAALTNTIPPFEWTSTVRVYRLGEEPPPGVRSGRTVESALRAKRVVVSPGFFEVLRIPLTRGRNFEAGDDRSSAPVVIVSRRLADVLWPHEDAIGRFVAWPPLDGPRRAPLRVIGVAEDTRAMSENAEPPTTMYLPFAQQPDDNLGLVVRSRSGSPVDVAELRRIATAIDPRVSVSGGRTLASRLDDEARPQRMASVSIGVFGVIALLLAGVGLYGVVAQDVLQRTRELAVRCALGASPIGILAGVLRDGLRLAAIGATIGVAGSVAAIRVLRSLFSGVHGADLQPAVVAIMVLSVAMLVATYLPARRASQLNPADALRSD